MQKFESKFVDAGGIRTRYVEMGAGEPLVLIHGGGAGADGYSNWEGCLPRYGERMRAIATDMVGFGETDRPSPEEFDYTQETRTQHMIDFIEALGLGSVYLIGNSMGGTTAFGVALKRPDLVKGLVLMGAAVNMTAQDMIDNRPNLAPVMAYDDTKEGMRKIIKHLTYDYEPDDELITYRYEASIRPDAKAAYKALMGWAAQNGLCYTDKEFLSVTTPTLVVAGKDDIMIPVTKTFELLLKMPQAKGYILPFCGHWAMIEYPEEFTEVTTTFFNGL